MELKWFATKQGWKNLEENIINYAEFCYAWKRSEIKSGKEFHKIHFQDKSVDQYRNLIIPFVFGFVSKNDKFNWLNTTSAWEKYITSDEILKKIVYRDQIHKFFFNKIAKAKSLKMENNILPIAFVLEVIKYTDNFINEKEIESILSKYDSFEKINSAAKSINYYRQGDQSQALSASETRDIRFKYLFRESELLTFNKSTKIYTANIKYKDQIEDYISFAKEFQSWDYDKAVKYQESIDSPFHNFYIDSTEIHLHDFNFEENDSIEDDEEVFFEGETRFVKGKEKRQRNNKIVRILKKEHASKNDGKLPCQLCGFEFSDHGSNPYCEAHHDKLEFGKQTGIVKTSKEDYLLLCSNCHTLRHLKNNEEE